MKKVNYCELLVKRHSDRLSVSSEAASTTITAQCSSSTVFRQQQLLQQLLQQQLQDGNYWKTCKQTKSEIRMEEKNRDCHMALT